MNKNPYAHEAPCWSVRLEREAASNDETEAQVLDEALVAVDTLTKGWVEPLALHLSLGCYDTETLLATSDCRPARPEWFLCKQELPLGVEARHVYVDPVIHTVSELASPQIRVWVAEALRQECPHAPRFIPTWRGLWWPTVRARIAEPSHVKGHDLLQVGCYAGTVAVPLEVAIDGVWVSGPLEHYVIGPPVELAVVNCDGLVTIDLNIYWSLWIDDSAGRAQVDAAVDRVLALDRGWQRSEG